MKIINIPLIPLYRIYKQMHNNSNINDDIKRFGYIDFFQAMGNQCFRSLFYYRCKSNSIFLLKIYKLLYPRKETLQIDCIDQIGGGMVIYHGDSSIIYPKSIGKNFTVYQQVTIGRGKKIDNNDLPVIGNNVTVYAGAIIVGGIHIGDNVTVGAGAVVVKDVPDNTTVVGAPVRLIPKGGKDCK